MDDTDYFIWKNTNEKAIILVTAKIIIKDGKSDLVKDGYYFVLISNYGNIPNINDNNVIGYMMYNCLIENYKDKYLNTFSGHKMHFHQIKHSDFFKVEIKISEKKKTNSKEFNINYLTLYETPDKSKYHTNDCAIFEDKTVRSLFQKNKRNTLRKTTLIKSMGRKINKTTNTRKTRNPKITNKKIKT